MLGCVIVLAYRRERDVNRVGVRFGAVVSKKVGNAVTRNRIKRHLREEFRAIRSEITFLGDMDLVVIARPSAANAVGEKIRSDFNQALRRLEQRAA